MTNKVAARKVKNYHNLVVGNVKNDGPSDGSYRLWHSDVIDPRKPNTILVHGASIRLVAGVPVLGHVRDSPNNCFCNLGTLLHNELYGGHNIWEFEYSNTYVPEVGLYFNFADLSAYGEELKDAISTVKKLNRELNPDVDVNVNIIAHSMGGLVARYAAQDGRVNKIVTLDTGHFGFNMAGFFDSVMHNIPEKYWKDALCVHQTAPGNEFLNDLNSKFKHCKVRLLSLAAGAPLLGIIVAKLESSHLGEVSSDGSIRYDEHCTPYKILWTQNHLSIIEIYDEYTHPAFDPIRLFFL
jgi:pimeloyl-ACP methyl ester carboxylesterase